jgi:hypothetical protein
MTTDFPANLPANEADVAEQLREVNEVEPDEVPPADVEADPADLQEQSRPVPSEEEDWREG